MLALQVSLNQHFLHYLLGILLFLSKNRCLIPGPQRINHCKVMIVGEGRRCELDMSEILYIQKNYLRINKKVYKEERWVHTSFFSFPSTSCCLVAETVAALWDQVLLPVLGRKAFLAQSISTHNSYLNFQLFVKSLLIIPGKNPWESEGDYFIIAQLTQCFMNKWAP